KGEAAAASGQGISQEPGGPSAPGAEVQLTTASGTKPPEMEKDGPMPIHGELFMGLHRSVGISETDLVFSFCPSFSIPGD
ncbi:hypothetical protein, partial [Clostridium sp. MCC353]|uniref:hypothetical protein n=1 Tax=Clostridium sp. MCC353 TaxID=2592646 RepID=UPI001C026244